MIRGFDRIVAEHELEVGRFYMTHTYRGPALFQWVQTGQRVDDDYRRMPLNFTSAGDTDIRLYAGSDGSAPYIRLPDVHIRIDPESVSGSAFSTSIRASMLLVRGEEVFLTVPTTTHFEWSVVNLSTGQLQSGRFDHNWLAFTRWSLVMDDHVGDELTIAEFDLGSPGN